MGDYTEHLISMAGGDGEKLEQIQRRVDRRRAMADDGSYRQTRTVCAEPSDSFSEHPRKVITESSYHPSYLSHLEALADHVPALLALAREQAAQIERGNAALFDVLHKWRAGSHVSYSDIEDIRTALASKGLS